MSKTPTLHQLANAKYISLRTFRKNGTSVHVPVWPVLHEDRIWVRTTGETFKAKRLRQNPRAEIALCNASGKQILSEFVPAQGRVLDDLASSEAARQLLNAKYGWQSTLIRLIHKYLRGDPQMVVLELTLT